MNDASIFGLFGRESSARASVISFDEMLEFFGRDFVNCVHNLTHIEDEARTQAERKDGQVSAEDMAGWAHEVEHLLPDTQELHLHAAAELVASFLGALKSNDPLMTYSAARVHCSNVVSAIITELGGLRFVFVPPQFKPYLREKRLFGPAVYRAFPDARYEIEEAGNCYAVGLDTAAVFHLMRAAENGVRKLAGALKVTFKPPIEFQQWGEIVKALSERIQAIEARKPKKKRTRRETDFLHSCHSAVGEFRHLKDEWRNNVMHSRELYGSKDAERVLAHVEGFLRHVAPLAIKAK